MSEHFFLRYFHKARTSCEIYGFRIKITAVSDHKNSVNWPFHPNLDYECVSKSFRTESLTK
jgi:hypothetical protein